MDPQAELRIVRAAYAKQILAAANTINPRLTEAFAAIRREDFVGPGPWMMLRWWSRDYAPTPDADPVYLYTNDLVALRPERRLNNGQPSLHAHLMHQAAPAAGGHVVHIGTGTGYYTAILAHLVGPSGRVTGIECDPDLAADARANLAAYANVEIIQGDGTQVAFESADVIYVNAGCTRPAARWLDGLAAGGRLILPLTSDEGFKGGAPEQVARSGAMFRIQRQEAAYQADWISPVAIIPCDGGRDEASEKTLAEAFARGGWQKVTRLYRDAGIPDERCWLRGPGWCLAYD
ncbi:protein-L-isoaspartate O-methyltransferase family protein [Bradyrhizobium brasilense]|uniref:Protein-L-isoaspartate O-methyltransferase n=1 Tax=Bradyrhizobium brasilense TaxID=1419277 RepID=A0A1G6KVA3_9BRAD|nr:methyltransferase domain-containing protein [Bradyrhizobium brasilense]MCC8974364.1 methyltransferase domain-containing protein [Bradyrhizobium brasilense]SDC34425.1 protein-L-isoaspartate(D-aspartate) O-methyltransferase [Bradyrhizobium brasilense]